MAKKVYIALAMALLLSGAVSLGPNRVQWIRWRRRRATKRFLGGRGGGYSAADRTPDHAVAGKKRALILFDKSLGVIVFYQYKPYLLIDFYFQYHSVKHKILPVQRQDAQTTFDSIMEVGAFSYSARRHSGEKVQGCTF